MIAILITVAVVIGALGVVYVIGAQPSSGDARRRKDPARGRTTSTATRARWAKQKKVRSPFYQPPKWIRRLPVALLIAAVVCLGVAVAQFRVSKQSSVPVVALVLDASNSMDNDDVSPTRLEAAEEAGRLLVDGLSSDFEVTLVSFASTPTVLVKPTTDHEAVTAKLKDPPRGRGTVIGDGLSSAIDQIQNEWAANGTEGPAAIVLLSDGKDTGSRVLPLEAAERAHDAGIPVYTVVLAGSNGKGADADLLEKIAAQTGGSSANADTASDLAGIFGSLGSQLSLQLSISSSAQLFVILAIALAIAAAVILLVLTFQRQG